MAKSRYTHTHNPTHLAKDVSEAKEICTYRQNVDEKIAEGKKLATQSAFLLS